MGLGPLLPSQAFVLGSQELDVKQGPFLGGLRPGALGHVVRPQLPEVGQGGAWALTTPAPQAHQLGSFLTVKSGLDSSE